MLENTSDQKTFVSTLDGKFVVKAEKGTRNAKERTTKSGATVYELQFDKISGMLQNIQDFENENENGKWRNIIITLRDADETYSVSMPYSSRESKGILYRMPNVDLTKPIKICIAKKEHPFTWVTQFGDTVKPMWTKDNPGDLPPMVETEINGKHAFDYSAQMQYLMEYIQTQVVSKIPSTVQASSSSELPPPDFMQDDKPY